MTVLITGAAGFIGFHVSNTLLSRGERVLGLDSVNEYYDVRLKEARLAQLRRHNAFEFLKHDLADHAGFAAVMAGRDDVTRVIHLAAQAGVRYSLTHPFAYVDANLTGHLAILEFCRHQKGFDNLVYASSSSVYGGNTKLPFSVQDRTDTPVSLYAATKRANELMSHSYAHLYGVRQTGLRFFTVYGPWGRPDMAFYIFTKAILEGRPLPVFNNGDMKRDFTFVDDIVAGILAASDKPAVRGKDAPHRVYNIGNHRSEPLMRVIELLEKELGKKAEIRFEPMQPGDVKESFADIEEISRDLGFAPTTSIDVGIPKFVAWYRAYNGV